MTEATVVANFFSSLTVSGEIRELCDGRVWQSGKLCSEAGMGMCKDNRTLNSPSGEVVSQMETKRPEQPVEQTVTDSNTITNVL